MFYKWLILALFVFSFGDCAVGGSKTLQLRFKNETRFRCRPIFRIGGENLKSPLVDPVLFLPGCTITCKGVLPPGCPLWIFPDGASCTAAEIRVRLKGALPTIIPKGILVVTLHAVSDNLSKDWIEVKFDKIRPLSTSARIITPNGDGRDDAGIFMVPMRLNRAWLKDVKTGEKTELTGRYIKNGELTWPLPDESPEPGFYEIETPIFHENPRGIACVGIARKALFGNASLSEFSPNSDGIRDEVVFTFPKLGTFKKAVIINELDKPVRPLGEPEVKGDEWVFTWDGVDKSGKTLTYGVYRCELEDGDGKKILSMPVTISSSQGWKYDKRYDLKGFTPFGLCLRDKKGAESLSPEVLKSYLALTANSIAADAGLINLKSHELFVSSGKNFLPCVGFPVEEEAGRSEFEAKKYIERLFDGLKPFEGFIPAYLVEYEENKKNDPLRERWWMMFKLFKSLSPRRPPVLFREYNPQMELQNETLSVTAYRFGDVLGEIANASPSETRSMMRRIYGSFKKKTQFGEVFWSFLPIDGLSGESPEKNVCFHMLTGVLLASGGKGLCGLLNENQQGAFLLSEEWKKDYGQFMKQVERLSSLSANAKPRRRFMRLSSATDKPDSWLEWVFTNEKDEPLVFIVNLSRDKKIALLCELDKNQYDVVETSTIDSLFGWSGLTGSGDKTGLKDMSSEKLHAFSSKDGKQVAELSLAPGEFALLSLVNAKKVVHQKVEPKEEDGLLPE